MEAPQLSEVIERSRQIYQPGQRVAEIDTDEALELGRQIAEHQCRILGANVLINADPEASVNKVLWQIDSSQKYSDRLINDPDAFPGPYYQRSGDQEIFIEGVAVYLRPPGHCQ